ncbi:MAG: hypothetical protein JW832_03495 [Deltaproteobacteria bacterium]|nr:hypothetical protein [Deltaproteobacteria bacterium]
MNISILTTARLLALLFMSLSMMQYGCSSNDSPPFFTAQVTNVYKEQTTVEHFSLLYTWEERGETPFLKPYSLAAKELIVEVMEPCKEDTSRVTVTTKRFPLEAIEEIAIELTGAGKQIIVRTKDGRRITATTNFPAVLKKDPASGFADMKMFVQGKNTASGKSEDYKLEFSFIKKISSIKRTDR